MANEKSSPGAKYVTLLLSSSDSDEDELIMSTTKIAPVRKPRRQGLTAMIDSSFESPQKSSQIYTSKLSSFRSVFQANLSEAQKLHKEDSNEDCGFERSPVKGKGRGRKSKRIAKKSKVTDTTEVSPESEESPAVEINGPDVVDLLDEEHVPKKKRKTNRATAKLLNSLKLASSRANEMLSSDVETSTISIDSDPVETRKITVKVRCESSIERIQFGPEEPFTNLLQLLAINLNHPKNKLFLTFKENEIDLNETLTDIGFEVCDIIDCWIVGNDLERIQKKDKIDDPNKINVFLQAKDDRKKTAITCFKNKPFHNIIADYANLKGLEPGKISLVFDGDKIDPDDTPENLDIEQDECFDVVIIK